MKRRDLHFRIPYRLSLFNYNASQVKINVVNNQRSYGRYETSESLLR